MLQFVGWKVLVSDDFLPREMLTLLYFYVSEIQLQGVQGKYHFSDNTKKWSWSTIKTTHILSETKRIDNVKV